MIWYYCILFISALLTAAFSFLPTVTTLPTVIGINVDALLVQAVSGFTALAASMWPLRDLFIAMMVWYSYKVLLLLIKLFLGARAPHSASH